MTNPFRDVKSLHLSEKRLLDVWNEMDDKKRVIVLMILNAIKGKYDLTDEEKVDALSLLPEFSDDEFALLCYYADTKEFSWFIEVEM